MEGWVEFRDKKKAKSCAVMLNGTQVGGRRRGTHFSDLWNMKYLPKFKWDNLTEEIEYQKALREQRMQLELSVAKKERDFYLQKVDQAKQIEKMKERRAAEAVGDAAEAQAPTRVSPRGQRGDQGGVRRPDQAGEGSAEGGTERAAPAVQAARGAG